MASVTYKHRQTESYVRLEQESFLLQAVNVFKEQSKTYLLKLSFYRDSVNSLEEVSFSLYLERGVRGYASVEVPLPSCTLLFSFTVHFFY